MASARDVANYIVVKRGPMDPVALNWMLFMAQGESLLDRGKTIFDGPMFKGKRGPVARGIDERWSGAAGRLRRRRLLRKMRSTFIRVRRWTMRQRARWNGDRTIHRTNIPGGWGWLDAEAQRDGLRAGGHRFRIKFRVEPLRIGVNVPVDP